MSENKKELLEFASSPEEVGVSSKEVQAFIDQCMEENKELHSVLVLRHGKVACEAYRAPFSAEYKHMMYSVSKSFTSTAIGFAVSEGLLTVETRFVDIFPEARTEKHDEYLEEMTIEDLLSMRSGKSVSFFFDKTKDRWMKDILESPWVSEPGTEFLYISENMYLLCCCLHKLTGMSVLDYLRPRLFEPLGIENANWETCPRGIEAGGWGLTLSTRDLAKFTLCYQQGGKFEGKQIIPAEWVETATAYHADNSATSEDMDSVVGYGYCFWRNGGYEKSYRADGMFCQFGIVFEDLDACLIITGGEINEQEMRDVIWEHFPKAFLAEGEQPEETAVVSIPAYEPLKPKPRSLALESRIDGKKMKMRKPVILNVAGFPNSVIPLPALFMSADKAGNITNIVFNFRENDMQMSWAEGDENNSIAIGLDGEYRWDTIVLGKMPYNTCSSACWNTENELEIHIRCIEVVAERILTFKFNGDNVVMRPTSNPGTIVMADSLKDTVKDIVKQPVVQAALSKSLPHLVSFIDAVQRGKIVLDK
ncbi:MAG: serine hydrolase [Oscillospiraceae bacterium]|nr:serine hydrolase [Oscillospiraceae bacterium]MDD6145982.1 serine hydrolase [Oscillospiraceae bacterium]